MRKKFIPHIINVSLISILILIIYSESINYEYTNFDDIQLIKYQEDFYTQKNSLVKSFVTDVFPTKHDNDIYYRPVLLISFILDHQMGGTDPKIYHITNTIYYILAIIILYALIQYVFIKNIYILFLIVATVALNPLFTSAVCWIPGRNASLLAIFLLASLFCFIKFINKEKKYGWLAAHFICLLLALFTKENSVVFIILLPAYLFFTKSISTLDKYKRLSIIGSWLIALTSYFSLRHFALKNPPIDGLSINNELLNDLIVYPNYIGKFITSMNLSPIPIVPDLNIINSLIGAGVLIMLLIFTQDRRLSIFGLLWYLLFLFPGIIFTNPQLNHAFQFEHRAFVPMIGVLIMLIASFKKFLNKGFRKEVYIIFLAYISLLSFRSYSYKSDFSTPLSYFKSANNNSPSCSICKASLANILHGKGDTDLAIKYYEKAISLDPKRIDFYLNLALLYLNDDQVAKAEKTLLQAEKLDIDRVELYKSLGMFYTRIGKYNKANYYKKELDKLNRK